MKLPIVYASKTSLSFEKYMKKHNNYIIQKAFCFGAVLFRGFDVDSDAFGNGVQNFNLKNYDTVGSAAPRTKISGSIYTANDSPPSETIPMHHEMAQNINPPSYIFFNCQHPSSQGGETPILNSRDLASYIKHKHAYIYEKLKRGVFYTRVMPRKDNPKSALGRGWENTFHNKDKMKLEEFLKSSNMTFKWLKNDYLKVTTPLTPAFRYSQRTNRETFFNSIIAAYTGWNDNVNYGETAVQYCDGSYIENEFISDVLQFMENEKVTFPWEKGDVLMIDNSIVMHSRNTFTPPRTLYASIKHFPKSFVKTKGMKTLASWDNIPMTHFGTWKLKNVEESVKNAILDGYKCIDCASDYGNEEKVGDAIKLCMDIYDINRKDLFITSKLWNTYHSNVRDACIKTLRDLKLDYLDLYLIHFPISLKNMPLDSDYPPGWEYYDQGMRVDRVPMHKVWRQMELLVKEGLVKNIGVCNFPVALLSDLLSYCNILPSVLQVEIHPENPQNALLKFCQQNDVHVSAFSPLGGKSYQTPSLLEHDIILELAKKYKCTPSQILLSWGRKRGTSVVVRSDNPTHIEQNFKNINIQDDDILKISSFEKGLRYNDPKLFTPEKNGFEPIYD